MHGMKCHCLSSPLLPAIVVASLAHTSVPCAQEGVAPTVDPIPVSLKNTLEITGVTFESSTNAIKVRWTADTTGKSDTLWDVGVFSSNKGYPAGVTGSPDTIKPNTAAKDSLSLILGDRLLFDTTYFFSCALRKREGAWSAFTPRARGFVRTPDFTRQAVKYGVDFPNAFADNGTVRISVDPMTFPTGLDTNTIVGWKPPILPIGFIPVGDGFEFYYKYQSSPLGIGVKYGALPAGHSAGDIKMYRYKSGLWFVEKNLYAYDSVNGFIAVTTGDIYYPFIAMIDVSPPKATVLSHPERAVADGIPVVDTVFLTDNIANVEWKFRFCKGGEAYGDACGDSGTLASPAGTVITVIPGEYVSADQGVRATLSISDGANTIVRNLSRRVVRTVGGSDVVTTDAMKWVPLRVTAQLDSPSAKCALKGLSGSGQWKYDETQFRLFRWLPSAGNDSNDYVEYSGARDSMFAFVPGRLFWIKTRKSVVLDFGRGTTPDLTDQSTIMLPARSWTDCALPYDFNIRIGDIIDATEACGGKTEGLRFCGWLRDTTRHYRAAEMYSPSFGVKDLRDLSTIIKAKQDDGTGAGYSVYNQSDAPVNLHIPPIPAAISKYKTAAAGKSASNESRTIKIVSKTARGVVLNDVYCVLANPGRERLYLPAAPSLGGGVTVRVCDGQKRQFGHVIAGSGKNAESGETVDLAVTNASNQSEAVFFDICGQEAMRTAFYNPAGGGLADDSMKAGEGWHVDVAPGVVTYCQLFVGDDAFLAKMRAERRISKPELIGVFRGVSGKPPRIRFALPAGIISRASFAVFDMRGRKLWNAPDAGRAGVNEIELNGMFAGNSSAGTYILLMKAFDGQGNTAIFHKKWTLLP